MKVLLVNTHDISGGAARSAFRLHQGLLRHGVTAELLVLYQDGSEEAVRKVIPDRATWTERNARRQAIKEDMVPYLATRPRDAEVFHDDRSEYGGDLLAAMDDPDVVNVHWTARFLDSETFFPFLRRQGLPLVFTLHDQHPFTGGCHYTAGCEGYRDACGHCPQLGSDAEDDLSRAIWRRRERAHAMLEPGLVRVVAPSRWLGRLAAASPLLGRFAAEVIPYGLDTDIFAPGDRAAARQRLGLPADRPVLLFSAGTLGNRRKGYADLVEALRLRPVAEELLLLSLGGGDALATPYPHVSLAKTRDDEFIAAACRAADLVIAPSLEDNLPNTVLEALACGTPAAGSRVGGIPDMIRPDETGFLFPPGDPAGIAQVLREAFADRERLRRMGASARRVVEAEYTLARQAARYRGVYDELVEAAAPFRRHAQSLAT